VRFRDLLGLALSALFQQKLRTLLTTLGVVFGSFVLVVSLSVRHGVEDTILREYSRFGELRQIHVHAGHNRYGPVPAAEVAQVQGQMSEAKRRRLRAEMRERNRRTEPASSILLTPERVASLKTLEHVRSVDTFMVQEVRALLGGKAEHAQVRGAPPDDEPFRKRLIAGDYLPTSGRFAVVSEYLLYRLGIVDDEAIARVPGTKLRLEYRASGEAPRFLMTLLHGSEKPVTAGEEGVLEKLLQALPDAIDTLDLTAAEKALALRMLRPPAPTLPASAASLVGSLGMPLGRGPVLAAAALVSGRASPPPEAKDVLVAEEQVTICGVLRIADEDELKKRDGWMHRAVEILLPPKTADELYFRLPRNREHGYQSVVVEVDTIDNVKEVNRQIQAMGLRTHALAELIEREQFTYRLIFSAMTVIAVVALLVAALGILNTMLMGVLERVREIGIMKAVGARDGHIQLIFLVEGALVGLVGGLLGLLLAWAGSFPADTWVRSTVESGLSIRLQASVFAFPWWLLVAAPLFACLITTLAAFYPARRAARVDPVKALRHD